MDSDNAMEEGEVCSSNEHSNDEAPSGSNPDVSFPDDRLVIDMPSADSNVKKSGNNSSNSNSPSKSAAVSPAKSLVNGVVANGNEKSDHEHMGDTEEEEELKPSTSAEIPSNKTSVSSASTTTSGGRKRAASSSTDEHNTQLNHNNNTNKTSNNNSATGGTPAKRKKKLTNRSGPDGGGAAKIARTQSMRRDASTWVRSIATEVDCDSLGPCEPGTHVNLDGVVWNETNNGLLVVNVTWRGKSYMGTLLDCTRFDWAPPRLCESPLMELTPAKGRTGKRSNRNNVTSSTLASQSTANLQELRRSNSNGAAAHMKSSKSSGKLTINVNTEDDENSQQGTSLGEAQLEPMSPVLRECPCKTCNKQFPTELALKYHQNAKHPAPRRPETPPRLPPQPQSLVSPIQKRSPDHRSPQQLVPQQSVSPRVLNKTGCISSSKESPRVKTELKTEETTLSPEENESLQQLFGVVSNSAQDFPKLEATASVIKRESEKRVAGSEERDGRAASRSPTAYSDISDDAAPVLEKEVPTNTPTSAPGSISSPTVSKVGPLAAGTSKLTAGAPGSSSSSSSKSVAVVQPQCSHQPSPQQADVKPNVDVAGETDASKHVSANMVAAAMGMPRASMPAAMSAHAAYAASTPGFIPPAFMAPYGLQHMVMLPPGSTPHQLNMAQQQHSSAAVSPAAAHTATSTSALHKIHELKSSTQTSTLSPQHSASTSQATKPSSSTSRTDTPPVQRHHHIHQHNMMPYFPTHHFTPDQYALASVLSQQSAAAAAMQNAAGLPPK